MVLELRTQYRLGPQRIVWYLKRCHGIKIAFSSVYRILVRNGVRKLPVRLDRRALHTHRYAKTVSGRQVQMDVKIVTVRSGDGEGVRRLQYTAADDATRVRALMIYKAHTQKNAISFFDYVVDRFPFRIHPIRTERGHEWQAQFHWHVEDHGVRHVYIRPRSPQLNRKVGRSHRIDQDEFYQLLAFKDDADLLEKLAAWERFYNLGRPHGSDSGQTPYEALRRLLVHDQTVCAG